MDLRPLFLPRSTDLTLGFTLAQLVAACNAEAPIPRFASVMGASPNDPSISFFPGTDSRTNCIIADDASRLLICIGGATSSNQTAAYINGVAGGPDPRDNLGSASNFYVAARAHLNDSFSRGGYAGRAVIIAGHSYGGAVAQVAAAYMLSLGQALSSISISFGSPRPGGPDLARRLGTMDNVRWMNVGDIVPWLLPHLDEIPAMGVIAANTLWNQTNALVQGPFGMTLSSSGQVNAGINGPPTNWGFFLSLYRYVADLMVGGAGPNHGISTYISRLQAAIALNPQAPIRAPQAPEATTTLRPRERDAVIAIGRAEIFADATSPTGETRSYIVPPFTDLDSQRYKPARDGKAWVVKLGEEIVGAAKGKRDAKRIAREWNRAARAVLRNGM